MWVQSNVICDGHFKQIKQTVQRIKLKSINAQRRAIGVSAFICQRADRGRAIQTPSPSHVHNTTHFSAKFLENERRCWRIHRTPASHPVVTIKHYSCVLKINPTFFPSNTRLRLANNTARHLISTSAFSRPTYRSRNKVMASFISPFVRSRHFSILFQSTFVHSP